MSLKVLISGAGIGGLALAQSLHRSGIDFEVFERDAAIDSRAQGYRLRMDANGDDALRTCLPPHLYDLCLATASIPTTPPAGALNHNLEVIYRFPAPPSGSTASPPAHVAVNRHTLRQVLYAGIENHVRFGREAIAAHEHEDSVRVELAEGSSSDGDLLVAAEGLGSPLRRQFLPDARITDLGMTCIYGRAPLTPELIDYLPEVFRAGFTPVLGPNRRTFGAGPYRKREPFANATARLAPTVELDPVDDYMMWILVVPNADAAEATASPVALHDAALRLTTDWHPAVRHIIESADAGATFPIAIRTSERVEPWPPSRITFLGDAIHAMTPAGGIGANTALRDAALLSYLLEHVATGTISLADAIQSYETEMRDYAFAAVERSLAGARGLYQLGQPHSAGA